MRTCALIFSVYLLTPPLLYTPYTVLRFPLMSVRYLHTVVEHHTSTMNCSCARALLFEAYRYHAITELDSEATNKITTAIPTTSPTMFSSTKRSSVVSAEAIVLSFPLLTMSQTTSQPTSNIDTGSLDVRETEIENVGNGFDEESIRTRMTERGVLSYIKYPSDRS